MERLPLVRGNTCCFSGHRPEKFPSNGDINSPQMRRLLSVLSVAVDDAVKDGYDTFISGMARGTDLWAARMVLEKKVKNPSLRLVCALPYRTQGRSLRGAEKWEYNTILESADDIYVLSEKYTPSCMKERNYFMVDNSSKLIAVVGDYKSGTGQTISYANKSGIDVRIIDINRNAGIFGV